MSYSVELTDNFKKEAKRLVKKYRSLKSEIATLFAELEEDPTKGTPLGNDIYKIRLAVKSKGKGKSGGVRILTYVKVEGTTVLLFSIYNKGERDSLSDSEIKQLIQEFR
ncbi:MAG: type II toxin-antitoxin system RelE/ParE family toxin [Flavobacteriales bacterium]|jgi:mRNA-degrading endonuclease RelE of RelBE toxin-antitoxin system|nr:type II toxin-antitoxin system RelE/ParE family toxin [Flavobacteriales bacterium]